MEKDSSIKMNNLPQPGAPQPQTQQNSTTQATASSNPHHIRSDSITEEGIIESSEDHRYIRFNDIIRVSFNGLLTSYKAFDTTDGVEIVWHKISIPEINEEVKEKFCCFMLDLKEMNHPSKAPADTSTNTPSPNHPQSNSNTSTVSSQNHLSHNSHQEAERTQYFVENVAYWFSVESKEEIHYLNIITTNYETIREFISKVKTLRWKIIKKWCRQIVQGLIKLHTPTHHPDATPIIHRYISCSHIYIDGGLGTIAIGDIWLSFQSDAFNLASSVNDGTRPNFDDPKGDVYAFGLCVLEMVSKDTSSRKKSSQPIIYTKEYIASVLPRINSESAKEFIQSCLLPTEQRPNITELQQHPFLISSPADDEEVKLGKTFFHVIRFAISDPCAKAPVPKSTSEVSLTSLDFPIRERIDSFEESASGKMSITTPEKTALPSPIAPSITSNTNLANDYSTLNPNALSMKSEGIGFRDISSSYLDSIRVVSIQKTLPTSREYELKISIPAKFFQDRSTATDKEVEFLLDFEQDDAKSVAGEMIEELGLIMILKEELAEEIEKTVRNYDDSLTIEESKGKILLLPTTSFIASATPPLASPISSQKKPSITDPSVSPPYFNKSLDKSLSEDDVQLKSSNNSSNSNLFGNSHLVSSISSHTVEAAVPVQSTNATSSNPRILPPQIPSPKHLPPISANPPGINASVSVSPIFPSLSTNSLKQEEEKGNQEPNRGRTSSSASVDNRVEETSSKKDGANSNSLDPLLSSSFNALPSTSSTRHGLSNRDLSADIILQKVLEKIDQEARAARRAFETRIQKLINIQEKCEEDLSKLKLDLQNKYNDFDKKEEVTRSKREAELSKLKQEFELKMKELRGRIKADSLLQQQNLLLQGQTITKVPSLNSSNSIVSGGIIDDYSGSNHPKSE